MLVNLDLQNPATEHLTELVGVPLLWQEWCVVQFVVTNPHPSEPLNDIQPATSHRSDVQTVGSIVVVVVQVKPGRPFVQFNGLVFVTQVSGNDGVYGSGQT